MRRVYPFLLCLPLMLGIGCTNPANTTPPPASLAPGYLNSTDQQMGEILAGAHAFYVQIQGDIAAGKHTPSLPRRRP